jgi:hypothetical protein
MSKRIPNAEAAKLRAQGAADFAATGHKRYARMCLGTPREHLLLAGWYDAKRHAEQQAETEDQAQREVDAWLDL